MLQKDWNNLTAVMPSGINSQTTQYNSVLMQTDVSYTYLGLSTVVRKSYPTPQDQLDLWGGTTGTYNGLDPFMRTSSQDWQNYASTPVDVFKLNHGYDRDSNRSYADDQVYTGYSHLYAYDNLNRLTSANRGPISSDHSSIVSYWQTQNEDWTLDALGNQVSSASGNYKSTFNSANEITGHSAQGTSTVSLRASDPFTSSATAANWSVPAGSAATFDINTTHSSVLTITAVATDTFGGYTEPEARALVLWGSPVGSVYNWGSFKFPSGTTSGQAGAIFGYKSPNDYWIRVADIGAQQFNVYHVVNGAKSLISTRSYTITAGSAVDISIVEYPTWLSYPLGTTFTSGCPSGQVGVFSTVAGVTVSYATASYSTVFHVADPSPRLDLCGRWLSKFWYCQSSGLELQNTANTFPQQPVLLKHLRLAKEQMTFSFVPSPATSSPDFMGAVFNASDESNYQLIYFGYSTGSPYWLVCYFPYVNSQWISGHSGINNPAESSGQLAWCRLQYDGTTLNGWEIPSATAPSEADWSTATQVYSHSLSASGGALGFLPYGDYPLYVNNVTIKSWDSATSAFDITEAIENFNVDGSNYANDTLTNDNNGNLTYDGTQAYTYDAWNRLKTVAHASRDSGGTLHTGQVSVTNSYDTLGRRMIKAVSGTGTWDCTYNYYLDGQSVVEEQNGSGQTIKQNLWGLGYVDELIQTSLNSSPATQSTCDTPYWAMQDANWNVLGIVNSSGVLTERYQYSAYGDRQVFSSAGTNDPQVMTSILNSQKFISSGSVTQPYGLCEIGHQGLMHDEECGLVYDRARMLNPALGRFNQREPFGAKYVNGTNLYENGLSNPIRCLDPSGLIIEVKPSPNAPYFGNIVADALQGFVAGCATIYAEPHQHQEFHDVTVGPPFPFGSGRVSTFSITVDDYWYIKYYGVNPNCTCNSCWKRLKEAIDSGTKIYIWDQDQDFSGSSMENSGYGITYTNGKDPVHIIIDYGYLSSHGNTISGAGGGLVPNPFPIVLWHETIGHGNEAIQGRDPNHYPALSYDPILKIENAGRSCWDFNHPGSPIGQRRHNY